MTWLGTRPRTALLAAGLVAAAAVAPGSAAAAAHDHRSDERYYLSLGDSIAYGYQRDAVSALGGFTEPLHLQLQRLAGVPLVALDLGCPGETTLSFTRHCAFADHSRRHRQLHVRYGGSQLSAATGFLRAHRGRVAAVTLNLGLNDLRNAALHCVAVPGCSVATASGRAEQAMLARLARDVVRLESADPGVRLAVAGVYDPETADPDLTLEQRADLDAVIRDADARLLDVVTGLQGRGLPVAFVDAYTVIDGDSTGASLCVTTGMCRDGDIHPSDAGYAALAAAFLPALEALPA